MKYVVPDMTQSFGTLEFAGESEPVFERDKNNRRVLARRSYNLYSDIQKGENVMERKAIINIHDIENVIYTDEKWLTFILSQIVQNAIKYFDKQENKLTIYSQDNGTNILLVIEDNGCGIKASDLSRVFEKGFTGSNRNKANATGMGLYLSKKLCDRLGLKLDIASTEKEYTRLTITFPKGTVHNFSE